MAKGGRVGARAGSLARSAMIGFVVRKKNGGTKSNASVLRCSRQGGTGLVT